MARQEFGQLPDPTNLGTGLVSVRAEMVFEDGAVAHSAGFEPSVRGWTIRYDGTAEFQSGTLGDLTVTGTLSLSGSGKLVTSGSGTRVEITAASNDRIEWWHSGSDTAGYIWASFNDQMQIVSPTWDPSQSRGTISVTGVSVSSDIGVEVLLANSSTTGAVFGVDAGSGTTAQTQVYIRGDVLSIGDSVLKLGNGASPASTTIWELNYSQFLNHVGTEALPSYSFTGDPNSGFWRSAADAVNLSVNGGEVIEWNTSQQLMANGYDIVWPTNDSVQNIGMSTAWIEFERATSVDYVKIGSDNQIILTDDTDAGDLMVWDISGDAWTGNFDGPASRSFAGNVGATVRRGSTGQSISASTYTALEFNTEVEDDNNWHDNATNPSRVTVDTAGWYIATAGIDWNGLASGDRLILYIARNGTQQQATFDKIAGGDTERMIVTQALKLSANDYVEGVVWTNSSGGATAAANNQTFLSVARLF